MAPIAKAKPAKKKATSANPDFKRIKAKVGKKAPKKANDTDTSFKAVSLKVSEQSVDKPTNVSELSQNDLYSARGRSIVDLTVKLQHPAAAVRRSAAKGLKDIVSQPQTDSLLIQAHLSAIVPATAKCCVDEEEDVRNLGLSVLQIILDKLGSSASTSLRPYASLLLAFVSSAMNSLDHETRALGAVAIEMLSRRVPSLVSQSVDSLLPAITRLLSDRNLIRQERRQATFGTKQITSNKKRGRDGQKEKNEENSGSGGSLLKALVALLETQSHACAQAREHPDLREPDYTFSTNEKSRNALFLQGHSPRLANVQATKSLDQNFLNHNALSVPELSQASSLKPKAKFDLWSKLRDILVEVTQKDQENDVYLAPADVGIFLSVVKAMRLFWSSFLHDNNDLERKSSADKIEKITTQISKLILAIFPISDSKFMYEVNAEICLAALSFGEHFDTAVRKNWVDRVTDYIVETLKVFDVAASETMVHSVRLLDVLSLLLLSDDRAICEGKHRARLVGALLSTFFDNGNLAQVAKQSGISRRAVGILCGLFALVNFDVTEERAAWSKQSITALKTLSAYLCSWGWSFPTDSERVIGLMHDIVRRNVDSLGPLLNDFRSAMDILFEPAHDANDKGSIFEHYPPRLQMKVLCLIVLVESPTTTTLENLARACARSRLDVPGATISTQVACFAVNAIHSIRKTISVKAYLGFLLDSIGIVTFDAFSRQKEKIVEEEAVRILIHRSSVFDEGLRNAAFCINDCGATKVFPLIESVLTMLLRKVSVKEIGAQLECVEAMHARAAIALLAVFSLGLNGRDAGPTKGTILSHFSDGIEDVLVEAMVRLGCESLVLLDTTIAVVTDDSWLRPLFVLLANEDKLLIRMFQLALARMQNMSSTVQSSLLKFLLTVVKSRELSNSIKVIGSTLAQQIRDLISTGSSDDYRGLCERILIELELFEQR